MKLRTNLLPRITALLLVLSMAFAMNCAAASVEAEELPDASVLAEQSAVYVEEDGSDEGDAVDEDWEDDEEWDDEEDASKDSEVSSQEEDTGPYTLPVRSGDDISDALSWAIGDYETIIIPAGNYTAEGTINLCSNTTIEGNGAVIHSESGSHGMAIRGCTNVTIRNLTIENGGNSGIYIDGGEATLVNVTVRDSYFFGIAARDGAKVTIEGGLVTTSGRRPRSVVSRDDEKGSGLSVTAGSVVTATGTTFSKNLACGIAADHFTGGGSNKRPTVNLYGVRCIENGDHGIGARPGAIINIGSNGKERSVFQKNTNHGVMLKQSCDSDFIEGADFIDNGNMGLNVSENASVKKMSNCTFANNRGYGIYIKDNASIKSIKKCTVSGNGQNGIRVDGSSKAASAKLVSVTVKKNKGDGIRITGSKASASISKSTFSNNKGSGIVVQDKAKLSSLINTKVTKNSKYGIRVYSKCTVGSTSGSSFSGNKGKQIYVDKGASTKLKTKK